jgi:short-subunit dehydrogenase
MDIQGRVIIITGASGGIGKAAAELFAGKGAKVVLAARSADKLSALASELVGRGHESVSIPTDMRDRAAINNLFDRTFERYGRIDILINNAGQGLYGSIAEVNMEYVRADFELNVFGALEAMQAAIPKMRQGGGGLIMNISSVVSRMHILGLGAYAATKSALNMISETARAELASENIRVITFFPRGTSSNFRENAFGHPAALQTQPGAAPTSYIRDTPEMVAEKILETVRNEPAKYVMGS